MNRAYRTVWSSARNAYVVASEKSKSRGKPSSTRSVLASAIALAFTAMAAPNAMAATSCNSTSGNPSLITVANPETACTLVAGDFLTLYSTGIINDSINTPVLNSEASPVTLLENNGTISFTYITPPPPTNPGAGSRAPAVKGAFTTIINSGTIAGANFTTSGSVGILLTGTSGTLTNSGTISAGLAGIEIGIIGSSSSSWAPSVAGTLTSLTNSGTISSANRTAIVVNNGSNLSNFTNQATGSITGSSGGFSATLVTMDSFVNQGAISATATGSRGGIGVSISGIRNGGAWVPTSGTSTSGTGSVWVPNNTPAILSGGLINSGTISGAGGGIVLDTVTVGGAGTPANITNSGSITASNNLGLDIINSTLYGDIINQATGTIASGVAVSSGTNIGIRVSGSTLGSISNSGTIGGGIVVRSNSALSGSITNASGGIITASNWGGIQVDSASVAGAVSNAGSITMSGSSAGIKLNRATVTGTVSNSGTITHVAAPAASSSSSSSASGGGISISGGTYGSLSNSGTISGFATGIDISGTASITGAITNTVNGVISATSVGVRLNHSTLGSFSNQGTIQVSDSWSGIGVSLFEMNISGGVSNSGMITAVARHAVEIGALNAGTSIGGFTNSGTLTGNAGGILLGISTSFPLYDGLQTLDNSGTIEGRGLFTAAARTGNGIGIYLQNASMTSITNSGVITGSVAAIRVNTTTASSTLTDLFIDGNNTAQFNGMVDAQATNVTILAGQTYTLRGTDDFRVANFTNNGTAQFAAGATTFDLTNVTGNTFTNNGVLVVAAGGTGTLTGNYTQAANATLRIGASDNTTYGKLVVSGTATLPTNANINVDVTNPNFSFTTTAMTGILTATTLTSDGTFAVTDNSVLFDFTAIKNGNAVDLSLAAAGGGAGTGPGNTVAAFNRQGNGSGVGAGGVIDELLARFTNTGSTGNTGMDAILTRLGTFTTDAELVAAVMQTVPTVAAALARASTEARAMVTSTLATRIRTASGQSSGDGFVTDGNAWFKPLGGWVKQDNKGAFSGYDANTYGFVAGADGELAGGARLGAALGITRTNVDDNSGVQKANVTGYQAGLYGSVEMAADYLVDWQADVGFNKNSGSRRITALGAAANSDYNGVAVHLGSGVSRNWELAGGSDVLTPSLRADYSHLRDEAYTETGAGVLNLAVNGQTYHELLLVADGMWTHRLENNATLSANLGVAYNAQARRDDLTSTYVGGGAAFGTLGINPSATTVRAGLGYARTTAGGMGVNLRYDVEGRSGYTAQSVSAKLSVPF